MLLSWVQKWFAYRYLDDHKLYPITVKELFPIVLALEIWGHKLKIYWILFSRMKWLLFKSLTNNQVRTKQVCVWLEDLLLNLWLITFCSKQTIFVVIAIALLIIYHSLNCTKQEPLHRGWIISQQCWLITWSTFSLNNTADTGWSIISGYKKSLFANLEYAFGTLQVHLYIIYFSCFLAIICNFMSHLHSHCELKY